MGVFNVNIILITWHVWLWPITRAEPNQVFVQPAFKSSYRIGWEEDRKWGSFIFTFFWGIIGNARRCFPRFLYLRDWLCEPRSRSAFTQSSFQTGKLSRYHDSFLSHLIANTRKGTHILKMPTRIQICFLDTSMLSLSTEPKRFLGNYASAPKQSSSMHRI